MKLPVTIVIICTYILFMAMWFFARSGGHQDSGAPPQAAAGKTAPAVRAPSSRDSALPSRQGKGLGPGLPSVAKTASKALPDAASGGAAARVDGKAGDHIKPEELGDFKPYTYANGKPFYKGEPVTAFVRVPSTGQQVAMTVNQDGEYPRLMTQPGEKVQVRLAFSKTLPDAPVGLVAQDGGRIEGAQRSMAGSLDRSQQLAFGYTVATDPGAHRVTIETQAGETKTLEFWAGPPMPVKQLPQRP